MSKGIFDGIPEERFGKLTDQENRLLENVKKAFADSDDHFRNRRPDCMEPMCRAIDAAKTLRRSLLVQDISGKEHGKRFKEFIDLEVPTPDRGGVRVMLTDAQTGQNRDYAFSDLVYAIRCMVHQNENLHDAENPDYHITLEWQNWQLQDVYFFTGPIGIIENGRITCNGPGIWGRLRQVMAKFITGIDGMIGLVKGSDRFSISSMPPLGSIRPQRDLP